ncbi:helix-turn-helix transcriptional regulator [Sphingobacterium sp.]|uniref:helix-turn-helix transcriptional regulator n=1 Tax=Sphingobacterium sp. TaxID=341027 RepID=UPI0031D5F8C1
MQIGCTEMHPIILGVIIIELIMLGAQGACYLSNPLKTDCVWHLFFLALLLTLNIVNGFLPNPILNIPLYQQYFIRNGIGIITVSYFPIQFFKKLQILNRQFQEKTAISYLLILSYPIIFFITYNTINDLEKANQYTIFVPLLNNLIIMIPIGKTIWNIYRRNIERKGSPEEILAFIMLVAWLFVYLAIHQNWGKPIETIFINLGPATFNIFILYNYIKTMRYEQEHLQTLNSYAPTKEIITLNCSCYMLSERETEVAILLCHRLKRQQIADRLFISVRTVDKHIERIFLKTGVSCRENLLEKINSIL